jgi:hypothetical protein
MVVKRGPEFSDAPAVLANDGFAHTEIAGDLSVGSLP